MDRHQALRRWWFAALVSAVANGVGAAPGEAAAEAVFANDRVPQVVLSPHGAHLAYSLVAVDALRIMVRDLDGRRPTVMVGVAKAAPQAAFLAWADDNTLLYAASDSEGRDALYAVNADQATARMIFAPTTLPTDGPIDPNRRGAARTSRVSLRVLGLATAPAHCVLVEVTRARAGEVYRINWADGGYERLGPGGDRVLYDWQGNPRLREPPVTAEVRTLRPIFRSPEVIPNQGERPMHGPDDTPLFGGPTVIKSDPVLEYSAPNAVERWRGLDKAFGGGSLHFTAKDEDFFAPRSFPLVFDADPDRLYFASNVGHDTFAIAALDLSNGTTTELPVGGGGFDLAKPADAFSAGALIFDRWHHLTGVRVPGVPPQTHWFDPALARLQQLAEARFGGRGIAIIDWTDNKTRAVLLVSSPTDAGRYFVFDDQAPPQFVEELRRKEIAVSDVLPVRPFSIVTAGGVTLTGAVTLPRSIRPGLPAVVVRCRDIPGDWAPPTAFSAGAQALANRGFMVLDVNYRGLSGLGVRHRDAVQTGLDRIPIDDVRQALDWLAREHAFDRRRVGLLGYGFGGYVALRAAQLFPREFRAVVSVCGPVDVADWVGLAQLQLPPSRDNPHPELVSSALARRQAFFGPALRRSTPVSLPSTVAALTAPVLIMEERVNQPSREPPTNGRELYAKLRKLGRKAEYVSLAQLRVPDELSVDGYRQIADFFTDRLFSYRVDVGQPTNLP